MIFTRLEGDVVRARLMILSFLIWFGCYGVQTVKASVSLPDESVRYDAESLVGRWLVESQDGVIEISQCGKELCGHLVGIDYTGDIPKDRSGRIAGRIECNLPILTGIKLPKNGLGAWKGNVLNPNDGRKYHVLVWSTGSDTLRIRGFVASPILGETQIWTRYRGKIGPNCRMVVAR